MAFEGTLQEITVNMHGNESKDIRVEVQQGDSASRKVRIHLKGLRQSDYIIPYGASALFCVEKRDGNRVYDECEIEDQSTLLMTLSDQAIACDGLQRAQVYIFSEKGDIKTQVFRVNVPRAVYTEDAIKSSNEFGILNALIADVSAVMDEEAARVEAEKERVENEEERQAAIAAIPEMVEQAVDDAIGDRVDVAVDEANQAAEAANLAASNADNATTKANNAASNAGVQAEFARNAASDASGAALEANAAAARAETATANANAAAESANAAAAVANSVPERVANLEKQTETLNNEIVNYEELICDNPYKFLKSVTTGKPIEGSAEIESNIYYFCTDNIYIGSENTLGVEFTNRTGKDLYIVIDSCNSDGVVNKIGSSFTVLNGDTWNYVFSGKYDYVKFHGRTSDMKSVETILKTIQLGFKITIKNYEEEILIDKKGISHNNIIERIISDESVLFDVESKIKNINVINVLDIGCKNDGVTNNSPILNNILDTDENITLYFPAGDYKINNTLFMYNANLLLDNGARIFTENELLYLLSVNPYTEETGEYKYGVSIKNFIKGGCFDGCDRAYNIIGLEHYTNFTIDDVKIYNFRYRGIECATDRQKQSNAITHGGLMVSHCLIRNWTDTGELSGTIGIDNKNAADNKFFDNTLVNCQIGIDTNFAIISRIHHWISFVDILADSVFVRNKNSFTTISDCCIDTVCCAVQSIGNQTRIINSTMFFNPLFVDENTFACFAKHGVSSGYVYAINCLFYMPTGSAKVSNYDASNFPDKYLMCRFIPEENFDFSNYNPLL